MSPFLAERLVRRLRLQDAPPNGRSSGDEADVRRVRAALERYGPTNLSELYMALRAVSADGGQPLIELVRRHADERPELGIEDFAGDAPR